MTKKSYFEDKTIKYANVFLSKTGKPLTHESIEGIVRNAGKECDVNSSIRCSPHTCRHTYAQMQLNLEGIRNRDVIKAGTKTSPLMNLK